MNKAPYIEFIDERTLKLIIRRQQLTEIGLRPARFFDILDNVWNDVNQVENIMQCYESDNTIKYVDTVQIRIHSKNAIFDNYIIDLMNTVRVILNQQYRNQ